MNHFAKKTRNELRSKGAKCFVAVEEVLDLANGQYVPEYSYGCMPPPEDGGTFQVRRIERKEHFQYYNSIISPSARGT